MNVRCFISVDVEESELLDAFVGVQEDLKSTGADLKLVLRDNIHITMRFLGDIDERLVKKLKGFIGGVEFSPFHVKLRGVGVFPHLRRPRVVWVGLDEGVKSLFKVYKEVESGLIDLGFRPESRGFSPHITLARVRSGRDKMALLERLKGHANDSFGDFLFECIKLKKSVLTPKGPKYYTLAESVSIGF
jgi:2'-5' RNA ligase